MIDAVREPEAMYDEPAPQGGSVMGGERQPLLF
jgi:hypothetical protein